MRNTVEHRSWIRSVEARSVVVVAVKAMLTIGADEVALEIWKRWRRFSSISIGVTLRDDSLQPMASLRRVKYLGCWKNPSNFGASRSQTKDLVVRHHHPYLFCLKRMVRPVFNILVQKAPQEQAKYSFRDYFNVNLLFELIR